MVKLNAVVTLENGTKTESAQSMTVAIDDPDIRVEGFCANTKASELFVVASYADCGIGKLWYIPYQNRRTDTFIDTKDDLVVFLKAIKTYLNGAYVKEYKARIEREISKYFGAGATVTLPIFKRLLKDCGEWVWNKEFHNENPQRRIQDIKETGFTLATRFYERRTYHMLLPFDPVRVATYETIPAPVRKAIFKVHDGVNAFTGQPAAVSCLPDHKFPEVRWDKDTPVSNDNLSVEEMRDKFQIVPENINQMKREVCRKCFQTGRRGMLNGINFFYAGGQVWNKAVPKIGKAAEKGCVGCFWYDMLAWRKALIAKLES